MRRFLELADVVCIGGGICFPFLAAFGHSVGQSLCPRDDVGLAREALLEVAGSPERLVLPEDLQLVRWGSDQGAVSESLDGVDVPDGWMALDIGERTAARYAEAVLSAGSVFWNGPMGRFELPQFTGGTHGVAQTVASTSATTVVGGGETVQAVRQFGLADSVNHLSTGDRAMLEFVEGRELPGVEVLRRGAPDPVPLRDVPDLRPDWPGHPQTLTQESSRRG